MKRYRKAFVAVIGVAALAAMRHFEVTVPGVEAIVMDTIVSALTAWGVFQVSNDA